MRKTIIVFLALLVILSTFVSAQTLQDEINLSLTLFGRTGNPADCIISTCDSPPNSLNYTKVGYVQFSGHYNQSTFGYELCCTDSFTDAQEVHGAVPQDNFGFSTDGHVADVPHAKNLGYVMETIGSRECVSRPAGTCQADELDAFRMSDVKNAHMGSSTDPNRPQPHTYNTSLCCKTYELCWDGVDNDGDGKIDCADTDCWGGDATDPMIGVGIYGAEPQMCTGSPFDTAGCVVNRSTLNNSCQGDDGNYYYCSYGYWDTFNISAPDGSMADPASQVGVCCPKGEYSFWNGGSWECRAKDECFEPPLGNCKFTFQVDPDPLLAGYFDRAAWLGDTEDGKGPLFNNDVCNYDNFIEDPNMPPELRPIWSGKSTGCCLIKKHGQTDYYFDPSNIEIFGYAE